MNSLEGYSTDGYDYRVSLIDRSKSKRLKWMMNEARDIVKKQDEEKKQDNSNVLVDKNITPTLHSNSTNGPKETDIRKNMFDPSKVNKFTNMKNSFK